MKAFRTASYYLKSLFEMMLHFKNWLFLWPIFLSKRSEGTQVVRLRRPPLRIKVRGRMDVWSVKETFLDQFYTRYGVGLQDGWTIVDVGAGVGDFSLYAGYGRPLAVVYALEPFQESYSLLVENLTLNAVDNVIAFQKALWGQTGDLMLDISGGEPLQIISQGLAETRDASNIHLVQALSLEDFLNQESIDQVDLMKLDCEGAEYEILMRASSQTLGKVDRLIMEYHQSGEGKNCQALAAYLEGEGYQVRCVKNLVHEDLGYLFATRIS